MKKQKSILGRIKGQIHIWLWGMGLIAILFLFTPLSAQDNGVEPRFLEITAVTIDRLPSIELQLRGLDTLGAPLDFNLFPPVVVHGAEEIVSTEVVGQVESGVFTLILVDTPAGVTGDIPALKESVELYLTGGYMREQVDSVALYQVGAQGADELLPATPFHNSVYNTLVEPFPEQNGPTALIDSLGGLIDQIDSLNPDPALSPVIVVFSDGTDVVSTRFGRNDLAGLAAAQGIPIHTVVLQNTNLREPASGQTYLAELARATGGVAAELTTQDMTTIWQRVDQLRQQMLVRYFLAEPTVGELPISVSFADFPAVQAGTQISLQGGQPLISWLVPATDQQLTLADSTQSVQLAFPTNVSWLDGESREITQAQLWVNGAQIADINPAQLMRFEAAVPLVVGTNQLWITLADNDAQQGTSPILELQVAQGDSTTVPTSLQATGRAGLWIFVVGLISVLLLFVGLSLWLWRQPEIAQQLLAKLLPRGRRNRPRSQVVTPPPAVTGPRYDDEENIASVATTTVIAGYALDVLESVTRTQTSLGIEGVEIRLGRSPANSDLTFENDITVSRLHATLVQDGESYRLFDERSTSGTTVNQEVVPDYGRLLVDGDEIELGAVRLRFRVIYDQPV